MTRAVEGRRRGIQVVPVGDLLTDTMEVVPEVEEPLKESDVAVVAGRDEDVEEVLEQL